MKVHRVGRIPSVRTICPVCEADVEFTLDHDNCNLEHWRERQGARGEWVGDGDDPPPKDVVPPPTEVDKFRVDYLCPGCKQEITKTFTNSDLFWPEPRRRGRNAVGNVETAGPAGGS